MSYLAHFFFFNVPDGDGSFQQIRHPVRNHEQEDGPSPVAHLFGLENGDAADRWWTTKRSAIHPLWSGAFWKHSIKINQCPGGFRVTMFVPALYAWNQEAASTIIVTLGATLATVMLVLYALSTCFRTATFFFSLEKLTDSLDSAFLRFFFFFFSSEISKNSY